MGTIGDTDSSDTLTIFFFFFFFYNLCADVYTTVWSVEVLVSKGRVLRSYPGTGQCRQNCELVME